MRFFRVWLRALYQVAREEATRQLVLAVVILLATGTAFYTIVEGWTPLDSLYFCVITVTTVGYGDFAPTTGAAKIFTILYVLAGISLIIAFANTILRQAITDLTPNERDAMAPGDRFGDTEERHPDDR